MLKVLVLLVGVCLSAALKTPPVGTRRAVVGAVVGTAALAVARPALALEDGGDVQTTASGLKFIEVKPGTGGQPSVGQ